MAADPYYPKVPAGSPLYQPVSVVMAHIDVFGGFISGSGTSTSGSGGVIGATARANVPLHDTWNLQLDVSGVGSQDSGTGPLTHTNLSGYGYIYTRTPTLNWGFYGGVTRLASQPRFVYEGGMVAGFALFDRTYVGVNAGLGAVNDGNGNGTMVRLGVNGRYELTPNAMLLADIEYMNITGIPGASYSVTSAGVKGKYRFDNSPWGAFVSGRWHSYAGDASGSTVQGVVGLTLNIDPPGSTLDDQYEHGPLWDAMPPMAFNF